MECPKCSCEEVAVSSIDERDMFCCADCKHQWYGHRMVTGAHHAVVDEIADAVSKNGTYEIDSSILLNTIWRRDDFHALAGEWCASHNISMALVERHEGRKSNEYAIFTRRQDLD